ncbi:MAG: DUF302 domain-containing protein [Pseudomonadota bacterium]|nr:DUF302 domain-containing protein [Pseudomonadota bacterium]
MHKLSYLALALAALTTTMQASAQQPVPITAAGAPNPFLQFTPPAPSPFTLPQFSLPGLPDLRGLPIPLIGTLTPAPTKPYTMRPGIPPAAKKQMMQMMMPIMNNVMRMSMPDAMNWFTHKIKVKPGLSFDEVVESMMLRANKLNFKYVGNNLMYKDFRAVLGDMDSPRIEVHSFCDIAVGRDLLKISPEFLVFLPCRIGVMEDADKNIWVMMLDWNLEWIAGYENQMGVSPELSKGAIDIRNKMAEIMQAGADGEL